MIGEVSQLVAAWLGDATHGVGALLASVPRSGSDPLPTTPTIIEETTDDRLGRGRLPETGYPYLAVSAERVDAIDENVVTDDGYFAAAVRVEYLNKGSAPDTLKRDGNYVLRAAVWSIRRLMRQDAGASGRLRNQIAVVRVGPIAMEPWVEQMSDGTILGGFVLQIPSARDYYSL